MPLTDPVEKPVMQREQILSLLGAIEDAHDLCLMSIRPFCGPRSSEPLGLQWKCSTGDALKAHGTAYEGGSIKNGFRKRRGKAPIPVPEPVRPFIEAWKALCTDCSPETLMFPTFGRGERTEQAVPRDGKNFLRWRIRPVSRKLGIADRFVTFQVMRRTMETTSRTMGR
jgi:integrase